MKGTEKLPLISPLGKKGQNFSQTAKEKDSE
jgi:hypothetical protein